MTVIRFHVTATFDTTLLEDEAQRLVSAEGEPRQELLAQMAEAIHWPAVVPALKSSLRVLDADARVEELGRLREIQRDVHKLAVDRGWWEGVPKHAGIYYPTVSQMMERMALFHGEVAEASEDIRDGVMAVHLNPEKNNKPEGFPTELADIIIRVMDLAEGMGIDLETEISRKHAFNKTRPYRHGGKLA